MEPVASTWQSSGITTWQSDVGIVARVVLSVANALVVVELLDVEHFPSIQPNAAFTKLDSAVSKCTSRQAYISAANKHPQTPLKAGVGQAKTAAGVINPASLFFLLSINWKHQQYQPKSTFNSD